MTTLLFTEQNTYINAPQDANASRIRGVSWHLELPASCIWTFFPRVAPLESSKEVPRIFSEGERISSTSTH